jgi:hypothetical protein
MKALKMNEENIQQVYMMQKYLYLNVTYYIAEEPINNIIKKS